MVLEVKDTTASNQKKAMYFVGNTLDEAIKKSVLIV